MGDARHVVEQFYKAFSAGDFEAVTGYFAPECITVTPAGPLDNAAHEAFGRAFKEGFPDGRMEIVRAVEDGADIFLSGRFVGTHTGDLAGPGGTIPASGRPLDMPFADYFRVVDGQIIAHEVVWDQLGMMAQLGVM